MVQAAKAPQGFSGVTSAEIVVLESFLKHPGGPAAAYE
jgi:hypothetical protein